MPRTQFVADIVSATQLIDPLANLVADYAEFGSIVAATSPICDDLLTYGKGAIIPISNRTIAVLHNYSVYVRQLVDGAFTPLEMPTILCSVWCIAAGGGGRVLMGTVRKELLSWTPGHEEYACLATFPEPAVSIMQIAPREYVCGLCNGAVIRVKNATSTTIQQPMNNNIIRFTVEGSWLFGWTGRSFQGEEIWVWNLRRAAEAGVRLTTSSSGHTARSRKGRLILGLEHSALVLDASATTVERAMQKGHHPTKEVQHRELGETFTLSGGVIVEWYDGRLRIGTRQLACNIECVTPFGAGGLLTMGRNGVLAWWV